jgi:hypothetical protein
MHALVEVQLLKGLEKVIEAPQHLAPLRRLARWLDHPPIMRNCRGGLGITAALPTLQILDLENIQCFERPSSIC